MMQGDHPAFHAETVSEQEAAGITLDNRSEKPDPMEILAKHGITGPRAMEILAELTAILRR